MQIPVNLDPSQELARRAIERQYKEMQEASREPESRTEESSEQSAQDDRQDRDRSEAHFEPICGTKPENEARPASRVSSRSSRSMSRVYSLSDGYTHPAVDNDRLQEPEEEERAEEVSTGPGTEYIVKWDGPDDPGNPRNRSLARKWVIVLVMAVGSVCVYVPVTFL